METTHIHLHSQFQIGRVDPRIFGGFLEHLGRAVYEGVYEPDSAHADQAGFRTDTMDALRPLDMSVMRYPGGNFASGYHWLDGIGPPAKRPTIFELTWQSIEPNRFGTAEYLNLCRKMNWTPMITVNLGSGTPEEAANWVEFCNSPAGTRYADLRANNHSSQPYGVKLWCLGNEMDGPWQIGYDSAEQYAIRAKQAADMMKKVDNSIELVVCGSSGVLLPTYMEWDHYVLEQLGDRIDYVSLHRYVGNRQNDTADYLAVTNAIDQQIEEMDAVCRFIQAKQRSQKRAYLCFDEWNVWYKNQETDGKGTFSPRLLEEYYNLEDALVFAGFFNSFIRHADVLKIANLAQIVNVIAPIMTRGPEILLQSTYYVFEMFTRRREGISLQPRITGPSYDSPTHGSVAYIDTSAILDGDQLHLFVTNRSLTDTTAVRVSLADRSIEAFTNGDLLTGPEPKAANSFESPDVIKTRPFDSAEVVNGEAALTLPPLSVAATTWQLS
ncbi:MAG: alpha-L-arabinofuranosidase C-terminal domain-containing protein [Candidatus Promineifilaceae bacterium]